MRALALLACLAFAVGCAQLPAPADDAPGRAEAEAAWGRVLARFVDEQGRVDYAGLARDRTDLDRAVAWIYAVSPGNRPEQFDGAAQVLAYHINAYNALAMYSVLEAGVPRSLQEYGLVRFFWLRRVRVGGVAMSLYAYENEIIRALGDERVHFALNCMAAGCPRLPRAPFRAATLDAELEREARKFFAEPRNAGVDRTRRVLLLSDMIIGFYPQDFLAKAPSLAAYANRYLRDAVPEDFAVEFIPYDWTVAAQAPR